jgi:hypothetical protein
MKKLGKLQINPEKLMNNEQLKSLRGGEMEGGTCGFSVMVPDEGGSGQDWNWVECNVSKFWAQEVVAIYGNGNWCCDSCSQTSYCG